MRRLYLLKEAIKDVTLQMESEASRSTSQNPVTGTDDELGWTIRFIRAAEGNRHSCMERCCQAYPHLRTLVGNMGHETRLHGNLSKRKDHALDLYRTQILAEMRRTQAEEGSVSEDVTRNRKSKIQVKLQRLKPGSCNSIAAMLCVDGSLVTEAKDIAHELRRHWQQIFQARPIDGELLQRWLREELHDENAFDPMDEGFKLLLQDIQKSVRSHFGSSHFGSSL